MDQELIRYLSGFVTEERFAKFNTHIQNRTKYLTVVLEDIFQPHNASAVLRTCDCFGIQDVHVIENRNEYTVNPDVALGASKWINLIKYNKNQFNSPDAIEHLRKNGYRIVATCPHSTDVDLGKFNLDKGKAALVFGTELNGISDYLLKNADEFLKIPMFGFTESFNISVSAGIILYDLTKRLRKSTINWQLSNNEKNEIVLRWLRNSIKDTKNIEKEFFKKQV